MKIDHWNPLEGILLDMIADNFDIDASEILVDDIVWKIRPAFNFNLFKN